MSIGYIPFIAWDGKYPVRCMIIDPHGKEISENVFAFTPPESTLYTNLPGWAIEVKDEEGIQIIIQLDCGQWLPDNLCWWQPVIEVNLADAVEGEGETPIG